MPPNLRSSTFTTSFPSHLTRSSSSDNPSTLLGRVLPFDDLISITGNNHTLTCIDEHGSASEDVEMDMMTEEDDCAKCPATKELAIRDAQNTKINLLSGFKSTASNKRGVKGRKSLSLTLLKPYDDTTGQDVQQNQDDDHDVEGVLERWLGLDLFDGSGLPGTEEDARKLPGAWVVVNTSLSDDEKMSLDPVKEESATTFDRAPIVAASSFSAPERRTETFSLTAWDGSRIEPMNLESELLTISVTDHNNDPIQTQQPRASGPFSPDIEKARGTEVTLAPEIQDMQGFLNEETERPTMGRARSASTASTMSLPAIPVPVSGRRRGEKKQIPSSALIALAGLPTGISSLSSSAISSLDLAGTERFVKLELEVDIEMELTCKSIRRKGNHNKSDDDVRRAGMSVVGREELGRLLRGAGEIGKRLEMNF